MAFASAIGGALLLPGALFADAGQQTTPQASPAPPSASPSPAAASAGDGAAAAGSPPHAALAVSPTSAAAGKDVRLDAGGSTGTSLRFAWDLDGNGSFETDGGTQPILVKRFSAGAYKLAVQVTDAGGQTADAAQQLTVTAPPPAPVKKAAPRKSATVRKSAPAHAAASSSVTIQNFAFSPGSVTVKTGDTITWTNRDSVPHTATASDGSFNTGTLKQGASGSHTFTKAGTVAYICAIHPNMHGTVVVTGASSGSSPSSSSGSNPSSSSGTTSGATPSATAAPSSANTLPNTGLDALAIVLTGLAFMTAGAGLRRLAGSRG
jgi:plastocyanin